MHSVLRAYNVKTALHFQKCKIFIDFLRVSASIFLSDPSGDDGGGDDVDHQLYPTARYRALLKIIDL